MLVAYGPEGQPVVAEERYITQLKDMSRRNLLYCPNCRGILHVRGGPEKRTQIHFAHQKGECSWSTEAETIRHLRGKVVLAEWLHKQFPQAHIMLEKRLAEPNRIADIFITYPDGRQWAIEFQCAPLEFDEWNLRHKAYFEADIHDIWIIGSNRRAKQDAFIEAIIGWAREVMFMDPLLTPPFVWIRWAITHEMMREWQVMKGWTPTVEGWVGRSRAKFGVTLGCILQEVTLGADGLVFHANRSEFEVRIGLLREMRKAQSIDKTSLKRYLESIIGVEALNVVLFPMVHAYLLDPHLFTHYNYGRGTEGYQVSKGDRYRVQQARVWLERLAERGFSSDWLEEFAREIPHVGPYTAFANYVEMLTSLSRRVTDE